MNNSNFEVQRWWELSQLYHEGVVKYGFASVQSCFLINGGAIIALLTLIGSLGVEISHVLNESIKAQIANVFFLYAIGLIFAVLTHCIAYINFNLLVGGSPSPSELRQYKEKGTIEGFQFNIFLINISRWLAVIFILSSVGAFLYASWCASKILTVVL